MCNYSAFAIHNNVDNSMHNCIILFYVWLMNWQWSGCDDDDDEYFLSARAVHGAEVLRWENEHMDDDAAVGFSGHSAGDGADVHEIQKDEEQYSRTAEEVLNRTTGRHTKNSTRRPREDEYKVIRYWNIPCTVPIFWIAIYWRKNCTGQFVIISILMMMIIILIIIVTI